MEDLDEGHGVGALLLGQDLLKLNGSQAAKSQDVTKPAVGSKVTNTESSWIVTKIQCFEVFKFSRGGVDAGVGVLLWQIAERKDTTWPTNKLATKKAKSR